MRGDQLKQRTAATAAALRRSWISRGQLARRYGITKQGAERILSAVEAEYGLQREIFDGEVYCRVPPAPAQVSA